MIVECNRCSTKYRVREDKFPEGGGNIRCPECGHVFFIKAPVASDGLGLRKAAGPLSNADDGATRVGTLPAALLGSTGVNPRVGEAEPAAEVAQNNVHDEKVSWKLKTSFGLVYDFPDTESLEGWLTSRDDLSGYQLSKDGQSFDVIDNFSELSGLSLGEGKSGGRGLMSSGHSPLDIAEKPSPRTSPAGAPSPVPELTFKRVKVQEKQRPSADQGGNVWFAVSALCLLLVFAVVGLQLGGVVNFKKFIPQPKERVVKQDLKMEKANTSGKTANDPLAPAPSPTPAATPAKAVEPAAAPQKTFDQNNMVKVLLEEANKDIRKREYDLALRTLLSAKGLDPANPEVYKLLEKVYKKKGMSTEARSARDQHRRLAR